MKFKTHVESIFQFFQNVSLWWTWKNEQCVQILVFMIYVNLVICDISLLRRNLKGWKTLNIFSCGGFKIVLKFWLLYGIHSKWKPIIRSLWFSNMGCCVGGKTFKILNAHVMRIKRCFQLLFGTCHFYDSVFNW